MSKLTLPIVAGKKYVRRDGKVATIQELDGNGWADAEDGECYDEETGSFYKGEKGMWSGDLVADYIEPAKGHPHAAAMAEFAKDAAESVTPWDRWEKLGPYEGNQWEPMGCDESFFPFNQYRRRAAATPDPHAASAAEYAKDMAETDKAWERWEYQCPSQDGPDDWSSMCTHPHWGRGLVFRRKGQS